MLCATGQCNLEVEHLNSLHEVLNLIPGREKKQKLLAIKKYIPSENLCKIIILWIVFAFGGTD